MANNRMYLVHRPTGLAGCLGTRGAYGWHCASGDCDQRLQLLFDTTASAPDPGNGSTGGQDDFMLVMEDASQAPGVTELKAGWKLTRDDVPDGLVRVLMADSEADEDIPKVLAGTVLRVAAVLVVTSGAAERRSDFTVEATYLLDGHKPVELLSLKVVYPDDIDTAISLKDEQ